MGILIWCLIAFSGVGHAAKSGFPSTVEELPIGNAHRVGEESSRIFRGSAPVSPEEIESLARFEISDVIIFKKQTKKEVEKEISALVEEGYAKSAVLAIPFQWDQVKSFKTACEQTVRALKRMTEVAADAKRKLYFHCTVGEDRTGYLAGLYRLLNADAELKVIFQAEMCKNGYEAGNPKKPFPVVKAIRENITPLFMKMVFLIEKGKLTLDDLNVKVCQTDPSRTKAFRSDERYEADQYRCQKSPKYEF